VYLHWLSNTDSDVAGYRIYTAPCSNGSNCPYDPVGATTGTTFTVEGLANGETRYFAVTAFDRAGNESDLAPVDEYVFDTPRPEGFDQTITEAGTTPATSGWDFSDYRVRSFDDPAVDIYYGRSNGVDWIIAPFADTEIQDAGYTSTLDQVDFAPTTGWAPSGTAELVIGHSYVVKTEDHFAKFRVTSLGAGRAVMDWAYQVDPGNRELHARRARSETGRVRRSLVVARQ